MAKTTSITPEVRKELTTAASARYKADKPKYKAAATKQINAVLKGPASGVILLANRLSVSNSDNGYEQCFSSISRKGIYGDLSEKQMNVLVKGLPRKAGFLGYMIAKNEIYSEYFAKNNG